ncbi:MAG: hypothetical protein AVDCRST_MAG72-2511, partial [uncultured Nocardioidaceae bacterium]
GPGERQQRGRLRPGRRRPRRRAVAPGRRDPRVRAAVVEVRGRQGAGGPREVRHVLDALLPGAERVDRPPRRPCLRPTAGASATPAPGRPPAREVGSPARLRGL